MQTYGYSPCIDWDGKEILEVVLFVCCWEWYLCSTNCLLPFKSSCCGLILPSPDSPCWGWIPPSLVLGRKSSRQVAAWSTSRYLENGMSRVNEGIKIAKVLREKKMYPGMSSELHSVLLGSLCLPTSSLESLCWTANKRKAFSEHGYCRPTLRREFKLEGFWHHR